MRTNIVIDDDLMAEAMQVTGLNTKREVVDEALRLLVRISQQKAVLELRGKINWEGNLDEMREGRFFSEESMECSGEIDNTNEHSDPPIHKDME